MNRREIILCDPAATTRLGFLLAGALRTGDVIALSGALGAGKSVLARGIVLALCPDEADIPSPTFTLVQTYDAADGTEIWHADLYRLSDQSEVFELGLIDAFGNDIVLIEWSDRLGYLEPQDALTIELVILENDKREVIFSTSSCVWEARLEKTLQK